MTEEELIAFDNEVREAAAREIAPAVAGMLRQGDPAAATVEPGGVA